jgi:hypothetical protein
MWKAAPVQLRIVKDGGFLAHVGGLLKALTR